MGIAEGSELYFGSDKENFIDLESVTRSAWGYSKPISDKNNKPFDLISSLVVYSWCGKRLVRYPLAKDAKETVSQLREEFEKLSEKFTVEEISECVSLIPDFDSRIIESQIKDMLNDEKAKITNSPLFKQLQTSYPQIEPEEFEIHYRSCRENFVEAGIATLRRKFKQVPPPELSDRTDWAQSNHQYLPAFLKKWREDLKKIENRMRIAQKAWKESIS